MQVLDLASNRYPVQMPLEELSRQAGLQVQELLAGHEARSHEDHVHSGEE